jgi:hypothetical protein
MARMAGPVVVILPRAGHADEVAGAQGSARPLREAPGPLACRRRLAPGSKVVSSAAPTARSSRCCPTAPPAVRAAARHRRRRQAAAGEILTDSVVVISGDVLLITAEAIEALARPAATARRRRWPR